MTDRNEYAYCATLSDVAACAAAVSRYMERAWAISVYAPHRHDVLDDTIKSANKAYAELSAKLALVQPPKLPLKGLRLVETAVGTVDLPVTGTVNGSDEPRPAA